MYCSLLIIKDKYFAKANAVSVTNAESCQNQYLFLYASSKRERCGQKNEKPQLLNDSVFGE